jgi:glycosyltransferase involved in cell wall biosynthesis
LDDSKNPAPFEALVQLESFVNLNAWRDFFTTWLKKAKNIYSPSNDTAIRLTNFFGDLPIEVKRHEQNLSYNILPEGRKFNVLLIGAIGPHKGYYQLLNLVKHAEQNYPELIFHIVGYTMNDEDFKIYQNVKIYGQYSDSTLPKLIKKVECSCALFLSNWPETYSYTLSEAIQNNVYPIVLDIGAPAERLREHGVGMILPLNSTLSDICKALINITSIFDLKSPII